MKNSEGESSLQLATVNEVSLIASLAERIWWEHYPAIITDEQIRYMLKKMYSAEVLSEQISESKQIFYLIKSAKEAMGFLSVTEIDSGNWMLNKFYLLKDERTRGVGTLAFQQLLPRLNIPKTIRLTVNRMNFKSINFYFKNGFMIEKVADFDIGNGFFMNDFVMIWKNPLSTSD
jgi:diamine N-acetyltransferase